MGWVIQGEIAKLNHGLTHSEKFVLLAFASFALDDGSSCYPALPAVAKTTILSVRTVRRAVSKFVENGVMIIKGRQGNLQFKYQIDIDRAKLLHHRPDGEDDPPGSATLSELGPDSPDTLSGLGADIPDTLSGLGTDRPDTLSISPDTVSGNPVKDPGKDPRAPPPMVPPLGDDVATAVSLWNDLAKRIGHPEVQVVSKARHRSLLKRLAECGGIDGWLVALSKVEASAFLRGANDRGWRADFDFLVKAQSFMRIMEGCYDDHGDREGGGGRGRPSPHARLFAAGARAGTRTTGGEDSRMRRPATAAPEGAGPDGQ